MRRYAGSLVTLLPFLSFFAIHLKPPAPRQVLRTGSNTEIGKAQEDVLKDKSVKVESVFYKKIMKVVTLTIASSLAMVVAVFLVNGITYDGLDEDVKGSVLSALSIMIAAIPIALPLVIQVNMALDLLACLPEIRKFDYQ